MSTAIDKISHKFRSLDDWHHVNKFSLVLIIAIFAAIPLTVFGATAIRQVEPQAFYNPRCSLFRYGQSTPVSKDAIFKSGDKAYIYYADFIAGGKARLRDRLYGGVHQELGTTQEKLFTTGRLDFTFKTGLPNGAYSVVINPANATSTNIKCADIKMETVPPGDTQAPSIPQWATNFVVGRTFVMGWFKSTDNVGVARYELLRTTNSGASTSIPVNDLVYEDKNLTPGVLYKYQVRAIDAANNKSLYSSIKQTDELATDTDKDGFYNSEESFIGTVVTLACRDEWPPYDRIAWPPDFDGDGNVNSGDVGAVSSKMNVAYDKRYDLTTDGKVDLSDQQKVASYFGKRMCP